MPRAAGAAAARRMRAFAKNIVILKGMWKDVKFFLLQGTDDSSLTG